jgi:ClpP class serine protease
MSNTKINNAIAARAMKLASCLAPRSAAPLRGLVSRWVNGESIDLGGLRDAVGGAGGEGPARLPVSLDVSYNWHTGELELGDAYAPVDDAGVVGLMEVAGPIMLRPDLFEVLFFGAVPQDLLVEALDRVAEGKRLKTLCLAWHTPGGSSCGCFEVTAAIERVQAAGVRVVSLAAEQMCSAGVFYGCMADEVVCTPTAIVGSVGTFGGVYFDVTGMLEEEGVKAYPVASHPRKAVGAWGAPVSEELLDDDRRITEKHFGDFVAHVAKHRGMSEDAVRALEARCYMGSDAVEAGLVDRVVPTVRAYLEELVNGDVNREPSTHRPAASGGDEQEAAPENPTMNVKGATLEDLQRDTPALVDQIKAQALADAKPVAAAVADLEQAFPGREKFVLDCVKQGRTMDQAKAAYADHVAAENKTLAGEAAQAKQKIADLEAQVKSLGDAGRGTQPVSGAGGQGGGAPADYEAEVARVVRDEKKSIGEATRLVNQRHPELRKKYVSQAQQRARETAAAN